MNPARLSGGVHLFVRMADEAKGYYTVYANEIRILLL
jgi:hypothetical protein